MSLDILEEKYSESKRREKTRNRALRGLKVVVPVDGLSANELYEEQLTVWQLAHGPGFAGQVTITRSDMIKF